MAGPPRSNFDKYMEYSKEDKVHGCTARIEFQGTETSMGVDRPRNT